MFSIGGISLANDSRLSGHKCLLLLMTYLAGWVGGREVGVTYLGKRAYSPKSPMNGNDCTASVGMLPKVMATLDTNHRKTSLTQRTCATVWSSVNPNALNADNSMASRIGSIKVSKDFAWGMTAPQFRDTGDKVTFGIPFDNHAKGSRHLLHPVFN